MSGQSGSAVGRVELSETEWRDRLDRAQFEVLREKGTEPAFSGKYTHPVFEGVFRCAGCGAELFAAGDQFDSGSGWPSFDRPIDPEAVTLHVDRSYGMERIEVTCARCGGHLGHVFDDGPATTGQRWCINSVSLDLPDPS